MGILLGMTLVSGCAVLHKVQLSDIEGENRGFPIRVLISENTINLVELGKLAKFAGELGKSRGAESLGDVFETYTMLFQWGPKTGTPVYNELYARDIPERLMKACPGGRVTDISSIRESREYPVVKGEVIRIDARCIPNL